MRAVDAAGNQSTTSYTWVIDTTPPTITLTEKPTDPSANPDPLFQLLRKQGGEGLRMQVERRVLRALYESCDLRTAFRAGNSPSPCRRRDLVGNTGSTNYTWRLDLVAPVATILSGPASSTNHASATFTFSSNKGGSSFQCQLDGGSFASCTSPTELLDAGRQRPHVRRQGERCAPQGAAVTAVHVVGRHRRAGDHDHDDARPGQRQCLGDVRLHE